MNRFFLTLIDGDRERAAMLLKAGSWFVGGDERHRVALASGDPVLIFVSAAREFVGRARLASAFTLVGVHRLAR
jgi:hypothetical protein